MKNSVLLTIYQYDTALFISMFCENKNRPQLHCNGQCQLAKMQQEENKKEAGSILQHLQYDILYYNNSTALKLKSIGNFDTLIKIKTPFRNQSYSFLYTDDVIKPPEMA